MTQAVPTAAEHRAAALDYLRVAEGRLAAPQAALYASLAAAHASLALSAPGEQITRPRPTPRSKQSTTTTTPDGAVITPR